MVLLLLALVWGALLVSWIRSRSSGTYSDSVGTFNQHLRVIQRTTPTGVRPIGGAPVAERYPYSSGVARSSLNPSSSYRPGPAVGRPGYRSGYMGATNSAALRRRQARKRRRDVFFALSAGTFGSFCLALLTGSGGMWAIQLLFDVSLGLYVALLVRMRNLAAERELKVRFMPGSVPSAMPRRARQVPASYDFGADGYGELEFRRAAN